MDKDRLEDYERQRAHNERMRKAAEEFAEAIDGAADAQREELAQGVLDALAEKYGLNDDEGGNDAA